MINGYVLPASIDVTLDEQSNSHILYSANLLGASASNTGAGIQGSSSLAVAVAVGIASILIVRRLFANK